VFIFVNLDAQRHPISGTLHKYISQDGTYHFQINDNGTIWEVYPVPEQVWQAHKEGEAVTIMVRQHQYRYWGDLR
jgi:hypothetical protein